MISFLTMNEWPGVDLLKTHCAWNEQWMRLSAACLSPVRVLWRGTARTHHARYCTLLPPTAMCAGAVAGDGEDSPCQVLYLAPTLCYVLVTCVGAVAGDIKDYSVRYCTLLLPSAMCWSCVRALWQGNGEDSPCQVLYLAPTLCYVLVTCVGAVVGDIEDWTYQVLYLAPTFCYEVLEGSRKKGDKNRSGKSRGGGRGEGLEDPAWFMGWSGYNRQLSAVLQHPALSLARPISVSSYTVSTLHCIGKTNVHKNYNTVSSVDL